MSHYTACLFRAVFLLYERIVEYKFFFKTMALPLPVSARTPRHEMVRQVTLDIASPEMTDDDAEEPEFVTPVTEKVAGGVAMFKNPVVTWKKPLRQGGNLAVVDATLSFGVGNGNS